jgi:metal transporter CNNM
LSTTLVLLFGEILPAAVFTGPNQLLLAYHMEPLVRFLLWIMYPVAFPCSRLLDYIVFPNGENMEEEEYNRGELSALVKIQYEQQNKPSKNRMTAAEHRLLPLWGSKPTSSTARARPTWSALKKEMLEAVNDRQEKVDIETQPIADELMSPMEKQEVDVVLGAMQMKTKVAMDVYTPRRLVYMIPDDLVLDREGVFQIYAKGYSRVPVYHRVVQDDGEDNNDGNRSTVMGFLMTRQLMLIDWDHEREVSELPLIYADAVSPRRNLVQLLKLLKTGGSHMAFVCARPDLANRALATGKPIPTEAGFMGIVTLEDIMESILQARIYDEVDMRDRDKAAATLTRWAAETLLSFFAKRRKRQTNGKLIINGERSQMLEIHNSSVSSGIGTATANERSPLLQPAQNNSRTDT